MRHEMPLFRAEKDKMRSLVILFVLVSYSIDLPAFSYSDFKELYHFVCARLAHASILYTPFIPLDYNVDISGSESITKSDSEICKHIIPLDDADISDYYEADISDSEPKTKLRMPKRKVFKKKKMGNAMLQEVEVELSERDLLLQKVIHKKPRKQKKITEYV